MKILRPWKRQFRTLILCALALLGSAVASHAAGVDPGTVGKWQLSVNGGLWIWEIHPDGTYEFHSEAADGVAPHTGTFAASDGVWSLQATNGYTDSGTYTLESSDTFLATGHLGTGSWRRVSGSSSPASGGEASAQSLADRIKSRQRRDCQQLFTRFRNSVLASFRRRPFCLAMPRHHDRCRALLSVGDPRFPDLQQRAGF